MSRGQSEATCIADDVAAEQSLAKKRGQLTTIFLTVRNVVDYVKKLFDSVSPKLRRQETSQVMLLVFPLTLSAINFFFVGDVFVVKDVMQVASTANHAPYFFALDLACSQDLLRKVPDTINMREVVTGIEFGHFLLISPSRKHRHTPLEKACTALRS